MVKEGGRKIGGSRDENERRDTIMLTLLLLYSGIGTADMAAALFGPKNSRFRAPQQLLYNTHYLNLLSESRYTTT